MTFAAPPGQSNKGYSSACNYVAARLRSFRAGCAVPSLILLGSSTDWSRRSRMELALMPTGSFIHYFYDSYTQSHNDAVALIRSVTARLADAEKGAKTSYACGRFGYTWISTSMSACAMREAYFNPSSRKMS